MSPPKDPVKKEIWRKNLSEMRKGEKNVNFGKPLPRELRENLSKNRMGKNNPFYNHHHTKKTRKLMSEQRKGEKGSFFGHHHTEKNKKLMCELKKRPKKIIQKISHPRKPHYNVGENNSHWNGGSSFLPYCPKFNEEFKERVRTFFGHQCQMPGCGHIWQPGETKLAVHHVNFLKDSCCASDVPRLFVPLCPHPCHPKTNYNRPYWEQLFTKIIMENFGGQCYLPKSDSSPAPSSPLPVLPQPVPASLPVSALRH